jgi:protein-S-isoprenylcysteine O-methyltransferase
MAAWKFFHSRISYEEYYLIKFFGKQYLNYQKRVPTGIPFVKGYVMIDESLD